jgi:predicted ATP-grasp superfamily ATP-dependent carboligase
LTDVPTGIVEVSGRRMKLRDYVDSLRHVDTDAVFSKEDPLPGIVEFLLLPYLLMKRGF